LTSDSKKKFLPEAFEENIGILNYGGGKGVTG
jgi:hypothetical protein